MENKWNRYSNQLHFYLIDLESGTITVKLKYSPKSKNKFESVDN